MKKPSAFRQAKEEKDRLRQSDLARIERGEVSPEELRRENGVFSALCHADSIIRKRNGRVIA